MCKYLTKTNGKVVYSRGLPDCIQADISEEDIITTYGVDERKYILFDNFLKKNKLKKILKRSILMNRKRNNSEFHILKGSKKRRFWNDEDN